ncbi:MAG: septum formation initiator family protein [Anaerolineae bacterium]
MAAKLFLPQRGESPWSPQGRTRRWILLYLALLCLGIFLHLTLASQIAILSYRIWKLDEQKQALEQQRAEIMVQIAAMTAPAALEEKARELGFVPAEEVLYIVLDRSEEALMVPPESALAAPEEGTAEDTDGAAWWQEIISRFAAWIAPTSRPVEAEGSP